MANLRVLSIKVLPATVGSLALIFEKIAIMNFLPTENIIYKTKLKEEALLARLNDMVGPIRSGRFGIFDADPKKPYLGKISDRSFKIKRNINYQNSFSPRIKGVIYHDGNDPTVKVNMRLSNYALVILFIWCSGVGLLFIVFLADCLSKDYFDPAVLFPLGMLLFAYGLAMFGFKRETRKSITDMKELLDAEILNR
jgi:hypothetical protein